MTDKEREFDGVYKAWDAEPYNPAEKWTPERIMRHGWDAHAERVKPLIKAVKAMVYDFGTAAGVWARGRPSISRVVDALDALDREGEK